MAEGPARRARGQAGWSDGGYVRTHWFGAAEPSQFGVGPPENLQRSFRPLESSPEGASGHVQDGYVFRFPGVREELALGLPRGQAAGLSPARWRQELGDASA